jgi:PHP family Zn ribbon phosphoesterase
MGVNSKAVQGDYLSLLAALGSEFGILLDARLTDIEAAASPIVAEAVKRVRQGRVNIRPGYDGEYGRVTIFDQRERTELGGQGRLL